MDELTSLQAELPELESQRNLAKRQLEEETLVRVDLENRLQSLKEELVFKKSLFDSELNETRRKKELEITEIGELDGAWSIEHRQGALASAIHSHQHD